MGSSAIVGILATLAGLLVGGAAGWLVRKNVAEKAIGSAEIEAKKILQSAEADAEAKKREAVVAAKEEVMQIRNDIEKETQGAPGRITENGKALSAERRSTGKKN